MSRQTPQRPAGSPPWLWVCGQARRPLGVDGVQHGGIVHKPHSYGGPSKGPKTVGLCTTPLPKWSGLPKMRSKGYALFTHLWGPVLGARRKTKVDTVAADPSPLAMLQLLDLQQVNLRRGALPAARLDGLVDRFVFRRTLMRESHFLWRSDPRSTAELFTSRTTTKAVNGARLCVCEQLR